MGLSASDIKPKASQNNTEWSGKSTQEIVASFTTQLRQIDWRPNEMTAHLKTSLYLARNTYLHTGSQTLHKLKSDILC